MVSKIETIYKATIEEENIEEIQRQRSIIEILLSKDEASLLLNMAENKENKDKTSSMLS